MTKIRIVLVGSLLALCANSATLILSEGQITGATGVEVGGTKYDVSCVEGSCYSLFSQCLEFDFTTANDAAKASRALLDQVLIGEFNTQAEKCSAFQAKPTLT